MFGTVNMRAIPRISKKILSTNGAAIVEFAVSLPLLIVVVVGIFDFSAAFNLKEKLNNAACEGAHFGAAQPTNDLCTACGAPPSVDAIRYVVDSYLTAARINDCGLATAAVPGSGPPWQYTASTGCSGTLTLTITRALALSETVGSTEIKLLCTQVNISAPYPWRFNNVIKLISTNGNPTLANIQSDAISVNQD